MGKGQLLFKGQKKSTARKNKKRKRDNNKHSDDEGTEQHDDATAEGGGSNNKTPKMAEGVDMKQPAAAGAATTTSSSNAPSLRKGSGKITSSGTVVTGQCTKFEMEVAVGDALMVVVNGQEELRVITMRLSNTSLNLSSAFSVSIKHWQPFQYIAKPKNVAQERKNALKQQREQDQEKEKSAFDLYSSHEELVYREKTETGSYRIKRQELDTTGKDTGHCKSNTRGDLLNLRSKKTSDKYC